MACCFKPLLKTAGSRCVRVCSSVCSRHAKDPSNQTLPPLFWSETLFWLFVCVFTVCLWRPSCGGGGGLSWVGIPLVFVITLLLMLMCALRPTQNTPSRTEEQSCRNVYWSLTEGGQRSGSDTSAKWMFAAAWKNSPGSPSLCVSDLSPVICETYWNYRLIVAFHHELALLYLWTKWFRQCPLIFMFRGLSPRPGSFPKSLPPPSRYQSLRAESLQTPVSAWTAVRLSLNHNIFVALQRWQDTGKSVSVCVCVHVRSVKSHPCSGVRVIGVREVRGWYVRDQSSCWDPLGSALAIPA